jgi:TetR/AcrR family transcriptional regulator
MAVLKNPELAIWDAARKIFLSKGLAGARMQDIADEAGINKALLHYYYRSKEKLFTQIFEKEMEGFLRIMEEIFESPLGFFEKIEALVDQDIDAFSQCPELPLFLLNELSRQAHSAGPEIPCMQKNRILLLFRSQVNREVERGTIRPVEADQLFIHLVSLIVYPFMAKNMIQAMLGCDDAAYTRFMSLRKQEICRFIFDSLQAAPSADVPGSLHHPPHVHQLK